MRNALVAAAFCALFGSTALAATPAGSLSGEWRIEGAKSACRVLLSGDAAQDMTTTTVSFVAGPKSCARNIAKVRTWHLEGADRIVMKDAYERPVMALKRVQPAGPTHPADY